MEGDKHKDKREKDTKEIQHIEYRMYENKYPNVDDLVMVSFQFNLVSYYKYI
jgi:hypothetical protein